MGRALTTEQLEEVRRVVKEMLDDVELSDKDAAAIAGTSARTIGRWRKEGKLAYTQPPGQRPKVRRSELERYIETGVPHCVAEARSEGLRLARSV